MTQLTFNIEDKPILPHPKKTLNAIDGVSIAKPEKKNAFADLTKHTMTYRQVVSPNMASPRITRSYNPLIFIMAVL